MDVVLFAQLKQLCLAGRGLEYCVRVLEGRWVDWIYHVPLGIEGNMQLSVKRGGTLWFL